MRKKVSDFYRDVSPPDSLSSMSTGTPSGKSDNPDGKSNDSSSLPTGDTSRNIGRPSPDSPNLKSRNLDRSESYGRTPAEGFDGGYVHDSGSGSARVIPYDSGFANNSSPLRKSAKNVPVDEKLWSEIQALAKGERKKPVKRGDKTVNPVNKGDGFTTFPSAYANGWALAQYNRLGGKWKKESSEFKMPRKWDKDHCESKSCDDMGFSEKASCRPYKNCYEKSAKRVAQRYLESAKRDDPKLKNTGKGGLGTWFAGHGGGDPDDRATWGDWIAITPVKHTITKEDGKKKTYEPGDIVGPCAISSEPDWKDVTSGGKKPLKCMPREKAWNMPKKDRAELAKKKRREEAKHRGKKPVNTPTFSDEAKEITEKKKKTSGLIRPPQDLLDKVSDLALGVLARYVMREPSTLIDVEDADFLESFLDYINDPISFDDAGELHDEVDDFRMEYWELKNQILNDFDLPKSISDAAEKLEECLKYVTAWSEVDKSFEWRRNSILHENKRSVLENDIKQYLRDLIDYIRMAQNRTPHQDDREFKLALSKLDESYLTKDNNHYHVEAMIEDDNLSHPIHLVVFFEKKRKVLGSHKYIKGKKHRIKIYVPSQRGLSKKDLIETHNTVRHELVHLVQTEIALKKNLPNLNAGLPFSKRDKKYTQWNRQDEQRLKKEYQSKGLDRSLVNFHALDDVEFYTRLLDEVEEFKADFSSPTNADITNHIRRKPFFKSLKHFKKDNWSKAVGLFVKSVKTAASQPAQDLGGVKTWVDKTRQDQINNDKSAPEKSREDYEDGKPQRDRVLPLPSGHPEGRDEQRVGPGVVNSPPDSSGQGGANRPKKDPSALNDHPDGKALHERPRSSGVPGDEYGNPYIDQSQSTGLKRRVMGSSEEDLDYWDIDGNDLIKIALYRYNTKPPSGSKRQRKQTGQAKRRSEKYKRRYRVEYQRQLITKRREHKRKKHNPTYKLYRKRYNANPKRFNRRPGGGVSTNKQKNQRAEKRRKK